MKPLHLSLSGLQSYREKQEVDFTKLCDAGVFGIFGPTGSGKSSILDAITLALYGKVERAAGGTQGILNQAEQTLAVSFAFELSGAGGKETYRVDRQYKRSGDASVTNTISRLVRIDGDTQTVVADKAGEVNAKVQQILGLSMQDFTRAVVLPQGKFAEFLALKGVDRRQMLQRLFHLEPYGDLLNAKVNQQSRETEQAVNQLEAEQQGLGDASEAALEAARVRLNEASAAAKEQREKLKETETAAGERKRLFTLGLERQALLEREKELAGLRPHIESLNRRLQLADQASRIRPYLEERESALQQQQTQSALFEETERAHGAAAELHAAELLRYEHAKLELEQNAGPLEVRIERLRQSLRLQEEVLEGESKEAELRSKLDGITKELNDCSHQFAQEQAILDKAVRLQAELKEKLADVEVKPELRHRAQAAVRDKQKLDSCVKLAEAAETELKKNLLPAEESRSRLQQLLGDQENLAGQLLNLRQAAYLLQGKIGSAESDAGMLLQTAKQAIEQAKLAELEAGRRELAAKLSASLEDGLPCPVCGSLHHPAPAEAEKTAQTGSANLGSELELLLGRIGESQLDWRRMRMVLESVIQSLQGLPFENAMAEAAPAVSDLQQTGGGTRLTAETGLSYEALERRYISLSEELAAVRHELSSLEADTKELQAEWQTRNKKIGEQEAFLQSSEAFVRSLKDKHVQALDELERIQKDWETAYSDMTPQEAEAEWERLMDLDRQAEELRLRLGKSDPFLESRQQKLAAIQQQTVRLDREAVQIGAESKGLSDLLAEKRTRLREQTGAGPEASLQQLLADTAAKLEELRNAEREGRKRLEQRQNELQQLSNRLAAVKQALASARETVIRAEANWDNALAETAFNDPGEVKEAYLPQEEIVRLEEETGGYLKQVTLLDGELSRLNKELQDREVTEEEWREWERRLAVEQELADTLLAQFAKAERDLEELVSKHERWRALERERLRLKEHHGRLLKLQSVLRGNAFVEYIAEEQLMQVSRAASERLGQLTRQRYALEVDSSGGFVIRDDANGGLRRPVSTLSGGETFLTSLSLALALSAQIQLGGRFPLEFFFLDEGFGTLDPELLETVVAALEKLHMERLTVGVISHVPELKARLPRRLVVTPAEPSGRGSRIAFESG